VETGRRRRWTDDEKLKIVAESMETPRAISSTARTVWHFALAVAELAAIVLHRGGWH
jgi:hypothetical protein